MRLFSTLVFILFSFAGISAQKEATKPTPDSQPPTRILDLLYEARLSPPEVRTDALLRIVQSKQVSDAKFLRELLEEALRNIGEVKNRTKKTDVPLKNVSV